MTVSPVGERAARPSRSPLWWLSLPLVLPLSAVLGYAIVAAVMDSTPRVPVATITPTPRTQATRAVTTITASRAEFTEATGLEVLRVGVSGGGGILDLRYRVVDEAKATGHATHQAVPAIIDAVTGKALATQWMGHAHPPDSFQPDRNYWMLFLNPNELVKRGDRVAVRLGHAKLTGVRVR